MKGLVLVTGSEGLVGSRFIELFPLRRYLHYPKQVKFDITDRFQVENTMRTHNFGVVINFAAYTNVSESENERDKKDGDCWQINVEGVRNLVQSIDASRVHFVQISTDLVFAGDEEDPGPYPERHPAEKDSDGLTWYGFTKAEAERVVLESLGDNSTILRLNSPVRAKFDPKPDYITKALKLYDEGKLYPLFSDQQISITYIDEACKALNEIIFEDKKGIFHASSQDTTTPFELISYVLEKVRGVKKNVESTTLDEFIAKGNDPRRYSKYSGLRVETTEKELGIKFSSCKEIVDKLISQGLGRF